MNKEEIIEEITCSVCFRLMELPPSLLVPKLLYCSHSFCEECLSIVSRGHKSILCPTCRNITPKRLESLANNITILHLIEKLNKMNNNSIDNNDHDYITNNYGSKLIESIHNLDAKVDNYFKDKTLDLTPDQLSNIMKNSMEETFNGIYVKMFNDLQNLIDINNKSNEVIKLIGSNQDNNTSSSTKSNKMISQKIPEDNISSSRNKRIRR